MRDTLPEASAISKAGESNKMIATWESEAITLSLAQA
jgi:hypothetical protein